MDTIGSCNNANVQDMDENGRLVHEIWLECSGIGNTALRERVQQQLPPASHDFCKKAERIKQAKALLPYH
jgi:nucleotidyltransferase/DNA polymerase involved in DNA repair